MEQKQTIIELQHVTKRYQEHVILKDLSLKIQAGSFYYIIGENGSGKSTLLKLMMGLLLPDEGEISLFGNSTNRLTSAMKSRIGFILASDRSLYYKLTASENLYYIGKIYGMKKSELKNRIPYLLNAVGLLETKQFVESFSTGMKKKLMIARALLHEPDIIFGDELFNGLDKETHKKIVGLLKSKQEKGKTIILVSHLQDYIEDATSVLLVKNGSVQERVYDSNSDR